MTGKSRRARRAVLAVLGPALLTLPACANDKTDSSNPPPHTGTLSEGTPTGRIAFRRFVDAERTAAVFTIATDGSGEVQVTRPPEGGRDALPAWSPDASQIAFQREYVDRPFEVRVIGAGGAGERPVDPTCPPYVGPDDICEETTPAWSPDGARLVFSWPHGTIRQVNGVDTIEVRGIAIMALDGTAPELLTQTTRPTDAEDETPVFSPDGEQIAFVRLNITAEPVDQAAVFVMNADGTRERQITPWALRAADIDWSPDGTLISFRSENHGADNVGDLYTVRPDGSDLTRLTDNRGQKEVFASSFSPDSRWLVLAMTGVENNPDLYLIRTNGTDLAALTATPAHESAPDWSPR